MAMATPTVIKSHGMTIAINTDDPKMFGNFTKNIRKGSETVLSMY